MTTPSAIDEATARHFAGIMAIARNLERENQELKHKIADLETRNRDNTAKLQDLQRKNDALKSKNTELEICNRDETATLDTETQDIQRENRDLELEAAAGETANSVTTKAADTKRKADGSTLADTVHQSHGFGIVTAGSINDTNTRQGAMLQFGARQRLSRVMTARTRDSREPVTLYSGNECAWCRNHEYAASHQLKDYVRPTNTGDIPGCPVYNTMQHLFDNCPTREAISENARQ